MAASSATLSAVAIMAALIASCVHQASAAGVAVVVLGDSLSDNGNFFKSTNGTAPSPKAYWKGRYTNAPGVWADQLPTYVKAPSSVVTPNFAFVGATACKYSYLPAELQRFPSADTLVRQYLAALKAPNSTLAKRMRGYTAVPLLWLGANDVQYIGALPTAQQIPAGLSLPGNISSCLANAARLLVQNGHKTVVVSTMAPFELSPAALRTNNAPLAAQVVTLINGAISLAVTKLRAEYTNATVILGNLHDDLAAGIRNATADGFKYGPPASCLDVPATFAGTRGELPKSICKSPNQYVFYDNLHPTAAGHRVIVRSVLKTLVDSKLLKSSNVRPVPLFP